MTTINEWTQTRAARLMTMANGEIETVGALAFIEYLGQEEYGQGCSLDALMVDMPVAPKWCLCDECRDRRMFIEERLSGLFVVCLGCGNVPIPRNRVSGRCVVCEEQAQNG